MLKTRRPHARIRAGLDRALRGLTAMAVIIATTITVITLTAVTANAVIGGHHSLSWNMQGSNGDKWAMVGREMKATSQLPNGNYDVVALQEAGSEPGVSPLPVTNTWTLSGYTVTEYYWEMGRSSSQNGVWVYFVSPQQRNGLAILSRSRASNVQILPQQPQANGTTTPGSRPALGIQLSSDNSWWWTLHASSNGNNMSNDADNVLAAIDTLMTGQNYAVLGDFNRNLQGTTSGGTAISVTLPVGTGIVRSRQITFPNRDSELDFMVTNDGAANMNAHILQTLGGSTVGDNTLRDAGDGGGDHYPVQFGNTLRGGADVQFSVSSQPGQCLDVAVPAGGAVINGTPLTLNSCDPLSGLQIWTVNPDGTITNGSMCLDDNGGRARDGDAVDLWECAPGAVNEQWVLQTDGSLYSRASVANGSQAMCLDTRPPGGPTPPPGAAGLSLRACSTSAAATQQFTVPGTPAPTYGQITQTTDSGHCLQPGGNVTPAPSGGWPAGTSNLTLGACGTDSGYAGKYWVLGVDGTLRDGLGACLDNNGAGTTDGNRVSTYPCWSGSNQKWARTVDGRIVNPATGMCLDSTAPTSAGGQSLSANYPGMSLKTCTGALTQLWNIGLPPGSTAGQITSRSQPGQCLDASPSGGPIVADTQLQMDSCALGNATQVFSSNSDGTITDNGYCLDNNQFKNANGNQVELWTCGPGNTNQRWLGLPNGQILNPATGKCLDTTPPSSQPQTPPPGSGPGMSLRTCNTTAATQLFNVPGDQVTPAFGPITQAGAEDQCVQAGPNPYYQLTFQSCQSGASTQMWVIGADSKIRNSSNGACLDNNAQTNVSGNRVDTYLSNGACPNYPNEQWWVTSAGWIVNPVTGMCLDSTTNTSGGSPPSMSLVTCTGSPTQLWQVPQGTTGTLPAFGPISNPATGQCLDPTMMADGTLPTGGAPILLRACPAAPTPYASTNKFWSLLPDGTIRNDFNTCLTSYNASATPGTWAYLLPCTSGAAAVQRWQQLPNGTLVNPFSGLCLANKPPTGPSGATGMSLQSCNGADPTQQWALPVPNGTITLANDPTTCLDGDVGTVDGYACRAAEFTQDWSLNANGTISFTSAGVTQCLTAASITAVSEGPCWPTVQVYDPSQSWTTANGMIVSTLNAQCLTLVNGQRAALAPCTRSTAQTLTLPWTEGHIQQQGNQSQCLDQSPGLGASTTLTTCGSSQSEDWTYNGNETVTTAIAGQGTGCLTAPGTGTNVTVQTCTPGAANQYFYYSVAGYLYNPPTDQCLTHALTGLLMILSSCTGSANQMFKLTSM
ncbi:endonuclease/exonuclease/phosphatase family metal-dependent hydrolase [Catenulispora sp. GP43]|uniref:ricin-type beta-trefoil lectin domain protein n=1 Tax=Catenulispora sp. GP43 TaxID=3156263 RepID=UPI003516D9D3